MRKILLLFALPFLLMEVCISARAQQINDLGITGAVANNDVIPIAVVTSEIVDTVYLPDSLIASYEPLMVTGGQVDLAAILPGAQINDGLIMVNGKKIIVIPSDNHLMVDDNVVEKPTVEAVTSHVIDVDFIPDSLLAQYGVLRLPNKYSDVDNLEDYFLQMSGAQKNDKGSFILESGREITQDEIELIKNEMKTLPLPD